jgi:hypothetical protein
MGAHIHGKVRFLTTDVYVTISRKIVALGQQKTMKGLMSIIDEG